VLEGTFACKQTLSTKDYWIKAKKQQARSVYSPHFGQPAGDEVVGMGLT
jgi:hypothetical protein